MAKNVGLPYHPWMKVDLLTLLKILEQSAVACPLDADMMEIYLQTWLQIGMNRYRHGSASLPKILEYLPGYRRIEAGSNWSRGKLGRWMTQTDWAERYRGWCPGDGTLPIIPKQKTTEEP